MVEAEVEVALLENISPEAVNAEVARKEATHHDSARQMVARWEAPQEAARWVSVQVETSSKRRLRESSHDSVRSSN